MLNARYCTGWNLDREAPRLCHICYTTVMSMMNIMAIGLNQRALVRFNPSGELGKHRICTISGVIPYQHALLKPSCSELRASQCVCTSAAHEDATGVTLEGQGILSFKKDQVLLLIATNITTLLTHRQPAPSQAKFS